MKNLISIIEIPSVDFSRAVSFYQKVLDIHIELVAMDEIQMGLFPTNGETVNISVIHGADYKPAASGTLVYFDAGDDLQPTLDRVEKLGGKVIVTKTEISPDIGFFALFIDSEGNKLGLHSKG